MLKLEQRGETGQLVQMLKLEQRGETGQLIISFIIAIANILLFCKAGFKKSTRNTCWLYVTEAFLKPNAEARQKTLLLSSTCVFVGACIHLYLFTNTDK